MNSAAYITAMGKFLPNAAVDNDAIETVLGMVNGRPSRARRITLRNNGTAFATSGAATLEFPNEWLFLPGEVSASATFEVYATAVGYEPAISGPLNTWLNLGTERAWVNPGGAYDRLEVPLQLQIREVASQVVQATRTIRLTVSVVDLAPG